MKKEKSPRKARVEHEEQHGIRAQSGALRAAVFGVNDGLVSNFSLVLGVAGAAAESRFVLLAGVAGLLAGAFSMAAGEFISMQVQREVFEKQIEVERHELATIPEEEKMELQYLYQSKGIPAESARQMSEAVMKDPQLALETHAREELGIDLEELGSPVGAAVSSFLSFVGGAILPVLPYIFSGGETAFWWSIGLSSVGLLSIGAALSLFTGINWLYSGLRMLVIGGLAAAVTYFVGYLFGVSMS